MTTPILPIHGGSLASASDTTPFAAAVEAASKIIAKNGRSIASKDGVTYGYSRESMMDSTKRATVETQLNSLKTLAQTLAADVTLDAGLRKSLERSAARPVNLAAATMGGLIAANPAGYAALKMQDAPNGVQVRESISREAFANKRAERYRAAREGYDKTPINTMIAANYIYHLAVVNQYEFAEALFPMVVVGHDVQALMVSLTTTNVFDNKTLDVVEGKPTPRGEVNVLLGLRNADLLKNDTMKLVPVWRQTSAGRFVDAGQIAPREVLIDGTTSVMTSYLKCGEPLDILALSQTNAMIAKGLPDTATDTIEPGIALEEVVVKIPNGAGAAEYFNFNVRRQPGAVFFQGLGRDRTMNLALNVRGMMIRSGLLTTANVPSVNPALTELTTSNLVVYFTLSVTGTINLNQKETVVSGNNMRVLRALAKDNATGQYVALPLTDPRIVAINAALTSATVEGYNLDGQRANLNHRERGQLLDTITFNELLNVNTRAPVSVVKPIMSTGEDDSIDMTNLIEVTRVRMHNSATDCIFQTTQILAAYKGVTIAPDINTQVLGLATKLVTPHYDEDTIDVSSQIASLVSKDVNENLVAVITNQIRERVFRMLVNTNYAIALESINGGTRPKVIAYVVCDPYVAQFIKVVGDLRVISDDIELRVMHNYDDRFIDKILITLGQEVAEGAGGTVNLMHTGCCIYSSELVTQIEIAPRDGQFSKELTVQPRWSFYWNLPIAEMLTITGIPQTYRQHLSIQFSNVPVGPGTP